MKPLPLLLALSLATPALAQHLTFSPSLTDTAFTLSTLRFYLTDLRLYRGDTLRHTLAKRHHLLDIDQPNTLHLPLDTTLAFDEVRFTLGVDSATAAGGVHGGDLDPTLGMYWTWRSGYVNFKLEGAHPESPARGHHVEYHLGGFRAPNNSERRIRLQSASKEGDAVATSATVLLDLDHFLGVDEADAVRQVHSVHTVMSPGAAAMDLMDQAAECFTLQLRP